MAIRVMHFGLGPIGAAVVQQVATRRGFKVVEIPITFVDREEGGSKMNRSMVVTDVCTKSPESNRECDGA